MAGRLRSTINPIVSPCSVCCRRRRDTLDLASSRVPPPPWAMGGGEGTALTGPLTPVSQRPVSLGRLRGSPFLPTHSLALPLPPLPYRPSKPEGPAVPSLEAAGPRSHAPQSPIGALLCRRGCGRTDSDNVPIPSAICLDPDPDQGCWPRRMYQTIYVGDAVMAPGSTAHRNHHAPAPAVPSASKTQLR